MDFDVTPTAPRDQQREFPLVRRDCAARRDDISAEHTSIIGTDLGLGMEYRPWLNNNCIIDGGIQCLIPGEGFEDIYRPQQGRIGTLFASFLDVKLMY